ncbi:class I SAM-dependent methyltransferase [Marinifilum caeruleilacunae]|uniref:Class I SAM-dependent methyltransferase n=1 Tax=Marinifilum caeruleilacunae TaxID=2499076 RepID=A0ABX1WQB7_9BACT|nr:class I SAM-dependent methyltransferase [Marinifilum caeruleilacunae]NOU58201.1 class I SAM-dependent methyltransferase [Marinifilum caeruleilacunae]
MIEIDIYKGIPIEEVPWKRETPHKILVDTIEQLISSPAHLLDLGCGLGHNAAYFSARGFEISGIDISETAINYTNKLFKERNLKGNFFELDLCKLLALPKHSYDLAYDIEVLHHIFPSNRDTYLRNVSDLLKAKSYYLSICFSEEDINFGGEGKFRDTSIGTKLYFSSKEELQKLMSKYFEVIEIKEIELEGNPSPHQAIFCLMQKM